MGWTWMRFLGGFPIQSTCTSNSFYRRPEEVAPTISGGIAVGRNGVADRGDCQRFALCRGAPASSHKGTIQANERGHNSLRISLNQPGHAFTSFSRKRRSSPRFPAAP
jgi:hypothetical protein